MVDTFVAGFPDVRFEVVEAFGEGSNVCLIWIARATHKGVFNGIPPTMRPVAIKGVAVARIENGKITRITSMFDNAGFAAQLSAPAEKPAEAWSRTARAACIRWFEHSLLSRLNDKAEGRVVLVMQRLHPQDLAGHLLDNVSRQYVVGVRIRPIVARLEQWLLTHDISQHLRRRPRLVARRKTHLDELRVLDMLRHTAGVMEQMP